LDDYLTLKKENRYYRGEKLVRLIGSTTTMRRRDDGDKDMGMNPRTTFLLLTTLYLDS